MSNEAKEKYNDRLYQELLTALTVLKKNIGIYPPGHTTIIRTTDNLLKILNTVLESDTRITIAATKKALLINGTPFESKSAHVQELALFLNQRGIGSLSIEKGISTEELQQFFRLALTIPQGSLLYQAPDIQEQMRTLNHLRIMELDFSGVLLTEDSTSKDTSHKGKQTTFWQDFMLNCLPDENPELRAAALADTTADYDREGFRQFCMKYNVTPASLLNSYKEMLKKKFSAADEFSSALVGKQAFFESLQNALVDLAEELKNQLMEITVNHLSEVEDEALIQDMLFSMPGEMLLAALERISGEGQQISPALTKLMANIARAQEQGGAPDTPGKFDSATREKIQKLLSKERYDEYVPEDYSDVLQKISAGLLSTDKTVDFEVGKYLPGLQDEPLNRDITIALMTLMNGDIDELVYADFCARVARGIADLIHAHEYALLVNVYKTLVHHVSHKEGLAARTAATAAVNAFSQERCIKLLAEAFSAREDSKDSAFEELVMLTGATNLGWLIRQYLQLYSGERGQQLFALLVRFGSRAAEEAVGLLPDCNDEQTMALLKLIRATGDNACIVPVRKLLTSDSSELRLEALRTLLKVKDASALPALRKMLYARNLHSAETALKFIQENDVQELAPDLASKIKTLFISRSSLARNKAYLSVLAALGNPAVLPVLKQKASVRFSFTPLALRQTLSFLYKSLTGYPRDSIAALVQQGLSSGNPALRRACQEIFNVRR
jgi:hypothetical protein